MITQMKIDYTDGIYEGRICNNQGDEIGSCTSGRLFTVVDCLCAMISEHERGRDDE